MIDAEPALRVTLVGRRRSTGRLRAVADFVDLKSPYTLGHARAVAELAGRRGGAARVCRRTRSRLLRRAALVHDLGRLGVSNAIWDKPGPLGAGEWERVRLHPYLTERMLHQSEALAPLAAIAVQHRERLDGSGYPKGLSGGAISRPARILGAVDAYQSMREPRPHRPAARAREEAAAELRADARAGKLDAEAVAAVLAAAGHPVSRRREWPAGLTSPRGRRPAAGRARPVEQADRDRARDHAEDRAQPHRAHLHEDRRLLPRGREPLRDRARAALTAAKDEAIAPGGGGARRRNLAA